MIEPAVLDEIRGRVLLSEIVGRRVRLRRAGREWKGLSPFNKERTPSFFVNDQKQFWHDFSSGKHGDIFSFVMEMEGRTFPQAVEEIAAIAGVALPATYCSATPAPAPAPAEAPVAAARFEAAEAEYAREVAERLRKARSLWVRSLPAPATIVETYLQARGYEGRIPATIRFLPRNGAYPPALIAAYGMTAEDIRETAEPDTLIITDENVVGVHLIKLRPDGSDRLREDGAKITIGKEITMPVVLAVPNDGLGLAIAEGIEDALIAHQETGLGAWAACSAGRLPKLAEHIPRYIECVTILVDDNEAGRVNSNELAARINQLRFGRTEVLMTSIRNST
jgi:CHC2 zinc finger/Toprim domain